MGKQNRKSKAAAKVKELQEQVFLDGDYLNGHLMHLKQCPETQPDIIGLEGVHIEVKRCQALRLSEWMKQAIRDSEKFQDGEPAVFHRRNREGWLVTMPLESWLRIYDQNCKQTD